MWSEVVLLVLLTYLASAVGTITSFGTSTIMVPTLSLFYGFNPVLLFTGLIHAVGNIGKMVFFRSGVQWKLIFLFGIPGIVFSYLGTQVLPSIPSESILRVLGIFIIAYVVYILKNPEWKLPKKNSIALAGGSLTGISAAVFGVQGAIRALFLSAFDLKKDVFLFTAGAIGLVIDSARIIGYLESEFVLSNTLLLALLFCVPVSFLGSYTGKKLVDIIPQEKFRKLIAIALLILAVRYLIWA
ncbi:MAG: sulfite exporter TauE/SafE family protein [Patescibacteria group bacterium]